MSKEGAGRLAGKNALITGAAQGLDTATAEHFAQEDGEVWIADIRDEQGAALVQRMTARDLLAHYCHLDVTSDPHWQDAIQAGCAGVDLLIGNAAVVVPSAAIQARTADKWDRVMAVNAKGTFLGAAYSVSRMHQRGEGSSSISRRQPALVSARSWKRPMQQVKAPSAASPASLQRSMPGTGFGATLSTPARATANSSAPCFPARGSCAGGSHLCYWAGSPAWPGWYLPYPILRRMRRPTPRGQSWQLTEMPLCSESRDINNATSGTEWSGSRRGRILTN